MKIGHDLKICAFFALATLCAPVCPSAHADASVQPITGDCAKQCVSVPAVISGGDAEIPYRTADEVTKYGLVGQDAASGEDDRDRAIENIGHEQQDISRNLKAVLLACFKKFGSGQACDKAYAESWDEFYDCATTSWDPVGCSKSVADRMLPIYATP